MKTSTGAARVGPQRCDDRSLDVDVNSAATVETQNRVMEPIDQLLTVEELASYLEVPVATIYAWRYHRQGPPGFRIGRHLRFRWSDVERWIEDRIGQTSHT